MDNLTQVNSSTEDSKYILPINQQVHYQSGVGSLIYC